MDLRQSLKYRLRPTNMLRSAVNVLPTDWRHAVYRHLIKVPVTVDARYEFKVARSHDELEGAFRILHDEYVSAGFMKPHPSGLRVTPYHAVPSTSTLVCTYDKEVIATVSVIRDSVLGFPLDAIFDTSHLRKHGSRLAEISSLAIRRDFRQNHGSILFPLLAFLWRYCNHFFGVDYMLIAVNPRHIEFYLAVLSFQQIERRVVAKYDFANGAPAVGAFLEVRRLYERLAMHFGGKPPAKNLFKLFTGPALSNFTFPDRTFFNVSDPVMTPELIDEFFNQRTQALGGLGDREKAILRALYSDARYDSVLPAADSALTRGYNQRLEARFEVKCSGRVVVPGGRVVKMTVRDASLQGFQAHLEEPIRFGSVYHVNVAIAEFDVVDLACWPAWTDSQGNYGFKVEERSTNWNRFVEHMRERQSRVGAA